MIPCVVLASTVRADASQQDLQALRNEYHDFLKGPIRSAPISVRLCDPDDQDGGNGSGLEPGGAPMLPEIATLGKAFYDFPVHPVTEDRDAKYPPMLRFELCLRFDDLAYAATFLNAHEAGQRLGRIFKYVEIVALSTPAFGAPYGSGATAGG